MAQKGQTILNHVTGEKITWLETTAETGGEYLHFEFEVAPGKKVAVRHIHPEQEEIFSIKSGELKLEIAGETSTYGPGQIVSIPAGKPHEWWNISEKEPLKMEVRFVPALKTEIFFEQFFGLANDGKTNVAGSPSFMQIMAMCNEYKVYIAGPPLLIQKIMGVVLGGIARLAGKKKMYPAYSRS